MSSSDRNPSPEHDATGSSARQHGGQDASVHIRRHPSGTGITRTFLQEIT
ncbi:hypothetical protein [Kocuria soli]|nr:hypothetical protein [Kocuria soli]